MNHYYDVCTFCKYATLTGGKVVCSGGKELEIVNPFHTCEYWHLNKDLFNGEWIDAKKTPPPFWMSVLLYIPSYDPMPTVREGFLAADYDENEPECYVIPATHDRLALDEVIDWMPMPIHE